MRAGALRALLCVRALWRDPGRNGAGEVARRRQDGDGRDDRPPRGLHEGLRHAEDGDDPRPGDLRRHRRGLHHGDRRSQHHV